MDLDLVTVYLIANLAAWLVVGLLTDDARRWKVELTILIFAMVIYTFWVLCTA